LIYLSEYISWGDSLWGYFHIDYLSVNIYWDDSFCNKKQKETSLYFSKNKKNRPYIFLRMKRTVPKNFRERKEPSPKLHIAIEIIMHILMRE
jgi:hypothetical protein